jgi:hypothetical protein
VTRALAVRTDSWQSREPFLNERAVSCFDPLVHAILGIRVAPREAQAGIATVAWTIPTDRNRQTYTSRNGKREEALTACRAVGEAAS